MITLTQMLFASHGSGLLRHDIRFLTRLPDSESTERPPASTRAFVITMPANLPSGVRSCSRAEVFVLSLWRTTELSLPVVEL